MKKFGLGDAKIARTPMATTLKLSSDADGVSVDPTYYRSMIGSLLYLTSSRPDIAYNVGLCSRYQSDPKESHVSESNVLFYMLMGLLHWDYFIHMVPYLIWRHYPMPTGPVALMIEKVHMGVAFI